MPSAITVDVRRLALGRRLNSSVHDPSGVLLIGAGTEFTEDLRSRLLRRGVSTVVVDPSDAGAPVSRISETRRLREIGAALDHRIAKYVQAGMRVPSSGPPAAGEVVQHGANPYDPERSAAIASQQAASIETVDECLNGDGWDETCAKALSDVGTAQTRSLTADLGNTLSVGFEDRDNGLARHSVRMATLGMAIAIEQGFDTQSVQLVGLTALLADIGMLSVPPEIRLAPRPLTKVELVEIQKHPILTASAIESMRSVPEVVQVAAFQVHESGDGSGYPRGLTLKSIHPFARIVRVADAFAAMISSRPHRPPLKPYTAMECILREARCGLVDGSVVRSLLQTLSLFPIGSRVGLSDGSEARVIRTNGPQFAKPIVVREPEDVVDLVASDLTVVKALPSPGLDEIDSDPRIESIVSSELN